MIRADGFVTRETTIWALPASAPTSREGLTIDLIEDQPPFSLEFYRQYVRDAWDNPGDLKAIRRWTANPRFYFRTATDDTGQVVPGTMLDELERVFASRVPELTGQQLQAAVFARGSEERRGTGWVLVRFYSQVIPGAPRWVEGRAPVGGDLIEVRFGETPFSDCGFGSVAVAAHELVHTMGFWHTGHDEFAPFGLTPCGRIGPVAELHARIAYSRPNGNLDIDRDPDYYTMLTRSVAGVRITGRPSERSASPADMGSLFVRAEVR